MRTTGITRLRFWRQNDFHLVQIVADFIADKFNITLSITAVGNLLHVSIEPFLNNPREDFSPQ